jgi:hypothetical protein
VNDTTIAETAATNNGLPDYLQETHGVVEKITCDLRERAEEVSQKYEGHPLWAMFVNKDVDLFDQAWRRLKCHFAQIPSSLNQQGREHDHL